MFVREVGKVRDKAKGKPVSLIRIEVLGGRERLESRNIDASRQSRVTRLRSLITGVETCPSAVGISPHTEIEMDSKVGLTAKRWTKGGNSSPGTPMLRDVRDAKERSFVLKKRW